MLDYERMLVQAVAQNPAQATQHLMNPRSDMGLNWFVSPVALKFFNAIADLSFSESEISAHSIMLHRDDKLGKFNADEISEVLSIWQSAKTSEPVDVKSLVQNIRSDTMIRMANDAILKYQTDVRTSPAGASKHIGYLSSRLDSIANFAEDYNPDPTAHYGDPDISIGSSWGSKILDRIFSGGVPSMGYFLLVAPTGFGKSTFCRSVAAYSVVKSVLHERTDVVFSLNELKTGETSRRLKAALTSIWMGERDSAQIDDDIRQHVKMYENVYSLTQLARQISWWKPSIAIVDSLDALDYPPGTEYMTPDDKHKARAVYLNDLSCKHNCFIVIPSNASSEHQKVLQEGKLHKVNAAKAFGSMWYEGKSSYAAAMTQDPNPTMHGRVLIKTTKNRPHGEDKFQIWPMMYSTEGKYYYDPQEIKQASLVN